ncbi:MAG: 4Fe-4S binding protein [Bacteroidales bacterium]|nr:4Fe-4S binding protein [Bacteroidales bacterium]
MKIFRIIVATIVIVLLTALFVLPADMVSNLPDRLATLQLVPAILALNVVVLAFLLVLTLVCGRLYCSIICPLGIFQDLFIRLHSRFKRNRFRFAKPLKWVRYPVLVAFVALIVAGFTSLAALIEPYSVFGRMAHALSSLSLWYVAVPTFVVIVLFAWFGGRLYCNSVCPVGTFLGILSRFSLLRHHIDVSKCTGCQRCARNCKAMCIDPKAHRIDYSRCVTCFDCIDNCREGAIRYGVVPKHTNTNHATSNDKSRRTFLSLAGLVAVSTIANAQEKRGDGGLANIIDKREPARKARITPPGSLGWRHLQQHCTACQLCVNACKNQVLRPSTDLTHWMTPYSSFEKGWCRPECTACGDVCPTDAIQPFTREEKTAIHTGHAVWAGRYCVANHEGTCDNCARHCPTGAITMMAKRPSDPKSFKIPVVNRELCIGCGACEYVCPARPLSAIHVEGHEVHQVN